MRRKGADIDFNDQVVDGVFIQRTTLLHTQQQGDAKGINAYTYRRLVGKCHTWRLEFTDTKQVLSIPFEKIAQVASLVSAGTSAQYKVKLSEFDEVQVVMQEKLL